MADQVKWRTVGIALVAGAAVALSGAWGVSASGILDRPAPAPTVVVEEAPELPPTAAVTPTATPAPTPELVVVAPVEEPAPPAPTADESATEPDYGQPVPWIPDPGNAEGGYWDTTACPSSAAYTAPDGNSYCSE